MPRGAPTGVLLARLMITVPVARKLSVPTVPK